MSKAARAWADVMLGKSRLRKRIVLLRAEADMTPSGSDHWHALLTEADAIKGALFLANLGCPKPLGEVEHGAKVVLDPMQRPEEVER